MVIKFTFPYSLKERLDLTQRLTALPALPDYIVKKGPYTSQNADESRQSIVLMFEFDDTKCADAFKSIFRQLEDLYVIPGFTFSTHIQGDSRESVGSMGTA